VNQIQLAFHEAVLENNAVRLLVATNCCCCAKDLKDALSAELGIGPVCRRHYYRDDAVSTAPDWQSGVCIVANYAPEIDTSSWHDARTACNTLIKLFAVDVAGRKWVPEAVYALGYVKLAEKLAQRGGRVEIKQSDDGTHFVVRCPTPGKFIGAVPGMTWDRKARRLHCPLGAYDTLWAAVKLTYPGLLLVTEKGITPIPSL
jgi:hypothetical protein